LGDGSAYALEAFAVLIGSLPPAGDFYCGIKVTKSPLGTHGSKPSFVLTKILVELSFYTPKTGIAGASESALHKGLLWRQKEYVRLSFLLEAMIPLTTR